jgi:hypothetical protein
MKKAIVVAFSLLLASLACASEAGENFGQSMATAAANAAIEQWIKMIPLFMLAFGIAVFFSLIRKCPEKAVIGCGGFFAVAALLGLFVWVLDFIAHHVFAFILLAVCLIFGFLILYMIYSPPSPQKKSDEYDPQDDKNNPFYEGPK